MGRELAAFRVADWLATSVKRPSKIRVVVKQAEVDHTLGQIGIPLANFRFKQPLALLRNVIFAPAVGSI